MFKRGAWHILNCFHKFFKRGQKTWDFDLEVGHYWVEGNKVHCNGTIKWHTTQWMLDGMNVALCIDRTGTPNAVDAELLVYGGFLLLAQNTIDSDSVTIPKLGEQTFLYDFSLTCTYHQ